MILVVGATCLALNTYKEARSTDIKDQVLINKVVIARTNKNPDVKDYCSTVFKKGQFSWTRKVKPKFYFASYKQMLAYYDIKDTNAWGTAQSASIQALLTYSKANDNMLYYHDNRIDRFRFDQSGLVVAYKTKSFTFYNIRNPHDYMLLSSI